MPILFYILVFKKSSFARLVRQLEALIGHCQRRRRCDENRRRKESDSPSLSFSLLSLSLSFLSVFSFFSLSLTLIVTRGEREKEKGKDKNKRQTCNDSKCGVECVVTFVPLRWGKRSSESRYEERKKERKRK